MNRMQTYKKDDLYFLSIMLKRYKVPFIIFFLISLIFTSPLFFHFDKIGIIDWDQWLFYYEALRKSILEYHQLPFWNPYYCGGNILFAEPSVSFFSPILLLVLLFGTITGIKIAITLHFFLGLMSMYLLIHQFKLHPLASYASAFVYMFSAQFALRVGIGTFSYLAMGFYPLAFLYFLKGQKEWKYVAPATLFIILAFFSSAINELAFFLLFLSIYALVKSVTELKLRPLILLAFIFLFVFLLASIKLVPALEFFYDNPRTAEFGAEESTTLKEFSDDLLRSTRLSKYYTGSPVTSDDPQWWEGNMAIGILGILFVVIGGFFCIKRENTLLFTTIILILIFLGGTLPISLWKLLHFFPPFNSLYVIGRLSVMLTFTFALLAGFGFSELINRFGKRRFGYYSFLSLLILLAGSLFFMNQPILEDALQLQVPQLEKNDIFFQTIKSYDYDRFSEIKGTSSEYKIIKNPCPTGCINSKHYLTIQENKGDLTCYEELLPATSVSAIPKESALYRGEAYLEDDGKVKILYFSPNKIVIKADSAKDNLLILNQNYEKNWKVESGKVENYQGLLATKIPAGNNTFTFYYFPNSFIIGIILSFLSLFLLYFFIKNYDKRVIFFLLILLVFFTFLFIYNSKETVKIPEIYHQLKADQERYSIIEIPFTSPLFHAFRYYAEQHDKEVIWHHPSQRITYKVHLLKKIFLADDPLDDKVTSDIIIQDPQRIALSVLNYYDIKKILLHKTWYGTNLDWKIFSNSFVIYNYSRYKDWYGNEHYNKTKELLDDFLDKSYEDEEIIVYDVPLEKNKQPFLLMDDGGYGLEFDEKGNRFSWVKDKFSIKIISFMEMNISLKLKVSNFYEAKTLEVYKDNNLAGEHRVEHPEEIIVGLKLNKGENKVEFKVKEKCQKPSEVLNSHDWRCLNVAIRVLGMVS